MVIKMKKLKIEKTKKSNDTVTRTIRISGETFDKISDLAEKNELSFNSAWCDYCNCSWYFYLSK